MHVTRDEIKPRQEVDMFWKKKEDSKTLRASKASQSKDNDDDFNLAQFGIKPVSDKDVEADLAKLMADVKKELGRGGSSMEDDNAFSDGESEIMRQIQSIGASDNAATHIMNHLSMHEDSDGDMDDVSDSDMNDPTLQAELNAILGAKAPPPPPQDERTRLQQLINEEKQRAVQLKREGKVQEALAALRAMKSYEAQLQNPGSPTIAQEVAQPRQQTAPIAANPSPIAILPRRDSIEDHEIEVTDEDMANPEFDAILNGQPSSLAPNRIELEAEIASKRREAVALKKNNQILEALAALRQIKSLEATLQQLQAEQETTRPPAPQQQITPPPAAALPPATEPEEDAHDSIEVTDEDMDKYDDELRKLHERPQPPPPSQPPRAPVAYSESSHLIDEFDEDEDDAFHDAVEPPTPPQPTLQDQLDAAKAAAVALKRQGKIQEALAQLRLAKSLETQLNPGLKDQQRLAAFEAIERQLVEFGNESRAEANRLLSIDRQQSLAQLNQYKVYAAALETLRAAKANPSQPPPSTRVVETVNMIEHMNRDVDLNQIEVSVLQLRSASTVQRDLFAKLLLNIPSQNPHELTTSSARGGAMYTFNSVAKFPIQRTRGLVKLCELRKAQIEVFTTAGFFTSSESVGKASLPLLPLVSSCEIHCWLPLMVGRRPCGLDIEIRLRLQVPLRDKEFRLMKTTTFVVDSYPPLEDDAPALPPPPVQVPSPPVPPMASVDISTDQEDPHDVELLVSYDVICEEMEKLSKKLEIEPKQEVVVDRYESLALKKQLLEIDMQSGKLTLDVYLERLRARIVRDKALARALFQRGLKMDAARVLHRVKVMEQEIATATTAVQEQVEPPTLAQESST
ncbi:hypothetical protein LEN26_002904 [Aphanomyces euteiches]|nr:hypothetical protein LEN26_002904 [Aphanomyces euteiches]